jgi:2-C-methyl-D-erythritol 4-phosphate cytidylyltransferase
MKNYAIILASGTGTRCQNNLPKQFLKIGDKTILEHTLDIFETNNNIDGIILVITAQYKQKAADLTKSYKKIIKITEGGETRKVSSYIGVNSIEEDNANVLIHDCARPLLSQKVLNECIEALKKHNAIVTAIPSSDTIIEIENREVINIPDRAKLMRVQTPQCFRLPLIKKAHELSLNDNDFTDDCGLVLKYNLAKVHIVEGDINNIKITYPQDIKFAQYLTNIK